MLKSPFGCFVAATVLSGTPAVVNLPGGRRNGRGKGDSCGHKQPNQGSRQFSKAKGEVLGASPTGCSFWVFFGISETSAIVGETGVKARTAERVCWEQRDKAGLGAGNMQDYGLQARGIVCWLEKP